MDMPAPLQSALATLLTDTSPALLAERAQALSETYRANHRQDRIVTQRDQALAYAAARMPATYGAIYHALEESLRYCPGPLVTLTDVGAGTGAASWAADALLDLEAITCLEREDAMRQVGTALMRNGSAALRRATWRPFDLRLESLPQADLVIAAYILNELPETEQIAALERLWQATRGILLIVEPGTPVATVSLQRMRSHLLQQGAHLAAPCPHADACPVLPPDWCHFACRVSRSRVHRLAKGGDAPYEDEKFSYMVFSRWEAPRVQTRVLRHPQVHPGFVGLTLCEADGIHTRTVSKKEGPLFKAARKARAGEAFPIPTESEEPLCRP